MKIFAIDPGTTESAYVVLDTDSYDLVSFGKVKNFELLSLIPTTQCDVFLIEMLKSYGSIMGDSCLHTAVWIGRYVQARGEGSNALICRKTIVSRLCMNSRAKDSNVRAALIDLFTERHKSNLGGGNTPVIGTKKQPGPLYGVSKDVWAALALAVVWDESGGKIKTVEVFDEVDFLR